MNVIDVFNCFDGENSICLHKNATDSRMRNIDVADAEPVLRGFQPAIPWKAAQKGHMPSAIRGVANGYARKTLKQFRDGFVRTKNAAHLFIKSHTVCYTLIAYRQAYLKAHEPELFYNTLQTFS